MSTIPSDAYRASSAPHDTSSAVRLLAITEVDASVVLPTGVYELRLGYGDTIPAMVRSGAAPTLPAPGPETGVLVFPGDVVTFWHDATEGDGELHALLQSAGSGPLLITGKAGGQ